MGDHRHGGGAIAPPRSRVNSRFSEPRHPDRARTQQKDEGSALLHRRHGPQPGDQGTQVRLGHLREIDVPRHRRLEPVAVAAAIRPRFMPPPKPTPTAAGQMIACNQCLRTNGEGRPAAALRWCRSRPPRAPGSMAPAPRDSRCRSSRHGRRSGTDSGSPAPSSARRPACRRPCGGWPRQSPGPDRRTRASRDCARTGTAHG